MQKENLALRITWAHVDVRPGLHWRLVAALVWVEEALALVQDELHDLVLKDHVHGDVGRLRLWPKESRAEYDCHILHSHAIVLPVLNHPVRAKNEKKRMRIIRGQRWQKHRISSLLQLLYQSKSDRLQALTWSLPLKDISTSHLCARLTEAHVILI